MQPLSSATGCEFVQVRIRAGIIIGLRPWIPTTKEQECRLDIILTPRPSCECQGLARAQWIADRQAELLEVPYFHVVFTVPMAIEVIAFQNQTVIYDILFRSGRRRCASSPPIRNIWEQRSASSVYCTRGDKTYYTTRIFIFSFLAVASRPTANVGLPAGAVSFCQ